MVQGEGLSREQGAFPRAQQPVSPLIDYQFITGPFCFHLSSRTYLANN